MSLFGDDDYQPSSRQSTSNNKSTLFDDGPGTPSKPTSSSIFADSGAEDQNQDESPWGFTPSKKKGTGGSLVKNLLADSDVPESYIDAFDALQQGGSVSRQECEGLVRDCGIDSQDREKIFSVVGAGGTFGRGEFNVLVALIGLAKEGEELGLDAVDERRNRLPKPDLPVEVKQIPQVQPPQQMAGATQSQESGAARKTSFGAGFGESDPWASPQMHKEHGHLNGVGAGQRTTSTFTTGASEPAETGAGGYSNGQAPHSSAGSAGSWGGSTSYTAANTPGFGSAGAGGEGEGFGDEGGASGTVRRPAQPRPTLSKGAEELVMVNLLEEKEGMFMFQHRNYEVASIRRNSKVIRRYSDFVWLLDCLHKRYPFRQLPLLPPKRVAINGNHIAADATFIEKRRRGLARFANALVRHPVLREEQLVVMFLTVPTVDACPSCTEIAVVANFDDRSLLFGGNRPRLVFRRSLWVVLCRRLLRIACLRTCRILSIRSDLE